MALIGVEGGGLWPPPAPKSGGPVRSYDVVINGIATTLELSDEDAAARGLVPTEPPAEKARESVPNKSRKPSNKAATPEPDED